MSDLIGLGNRIMPMGKLAINKVSQLESMALRMPQRDIVTEHILHGGMYTRTILVPSGVMLTGALIKIATVLIVCGDAIVYIGGDSIELQGYNVLAASANRKQAFLAMSDVYLTMIFPSDAIDIMSAEIEFTDESHLLMSRRESAENKIIITGE